MTNDQKSQSESRAAVDHPTSDGPSTGIGAGTASEHHQAIQAIAAWFERTFASVDVAELQKAHLLNELTPKLEESVKQKFKVHFLVVSGIITAASIFLVLHLELSLQNYFDDQITEHGKEFNEFRIEKSVHILQLETELELLIDKAKQTEQKLFLDPTPFPQHPTLQLTPPRTINPIEKGKI